VWQQIQTVNHAHDLDLSWGGTDRRRKAVDGGSTSYVEQSVVPEVPTSEKATLRHVWLTFRVTGGGKEGKEGQEERRKEMVTKVNWL